MHALSQRKTFSICFVLCFVVSFALASPVFAESPALVVDRGLAQANLNTAAGDYRSNVRWSLYDGGFLGDDFSVGAAGESWVIDAVRVWTVPGAASTEAEHLGDFYHDVRLYFGGDREGLTPVVAAQLQRGSDAVSNSHVLISDLTKSGAASYDDFGTNLHVWQIDFTGLNLAVQGGAKYSFAAFGLGRPMPNRAGKTYAWFNAASNAEFSDAKHDGADGQMLLFTSGGKFKSVFDGKGAGWDKSSDIDVQVFAHKVSAQ
jgi:hypothetical protein